MNIIVPLSEDVGMWLEDLIRFIVPAIVLTYVLGEVIGSLTKRAYVALYRVLIASGCLIPNNNYMRLAGPYRGLSDMSDV